LNTQYIKKQKVNEADISYGGFNVELSEQMYEIGEVRNTHWLYAVNTSIKFCGIKFTNGNGNC